MKRIKLTFCCVCLSRVRAIVRAHSCAPPNACTPTQKMRMGRFAISNGPASPREIAEACVRSVQAAVPVPIEVSVDASVPPLVRELTDGCAVLRGFDVV